jgi:ABC-type xylose transport system permease subunit
MRIPPSVTGPEAAPTVLVMSHRQPAASSFLAHWLGSPFVWLVAGVMVAVLGSLIGWQQYRQGWWPTHLQVPAAALRAQLNPP